MLDPDDILKGTVSAATARLNKLPAPEPAPFDVEEQAQIRARRIRSLDAYSHLWPDAEDQTREAVDQVLGRPAPGRGSEAAR